MGQMFDWLKDIRGPIETRSIPTSGSGWSRNVDVEKFPSRRVKLNIRDGSYAGVRYTQIEAKLDGTRIEKIFMATVTDLDGTATEYHGKLEPKGVLELLRAHSLL